jgi:hypothetical protein
MARVKTNLIIINGVAVPAPDAGFTISEGVLVDGARNANGVVVGQVIGRPNWKIEDLQWSHLTPEQWGELREALKPFYVKVTFTGDDNKRHTVTMYPGDKKAKPLGVANLKYKAFTECKFNLIDCGKKGED